MHSPTNARSRSRRSLAAVTAVGVLVMVPATAAFADEPVDDAPDTQPATPEVQLPAEEQVDQVAAPETAAPETAAPETAAPETAAPATPVPVADDASAPLAATSSDPLAAPPLVEGYYGTRKVFPGVVAPGEDPTPDLTSTLTVTRQDGDSVLGTETIVTDSDGSYGGPFGYDQNAGEQLSITLTTAPEGFLLPEDASQLIDYCVVEVEGATCANELATFAVVRDYRTVGVAATTPAGVPVAGMTVELHSPEAGPSPSPSPTPTETGPADPGGPPFDVAADVAAVEIPDRTLIATGVTDGAGGIVFDTTVPPGDDYLLVPTSVPAGYLLPDRVSVDIAAVDTVVEANVPLAVPIAVVPVAVAPPVTPAAATLPDTGSESAALAGLAVALAVAGAGAVWAGRRAATR